jgi:parallel beta-helix repeat protein
MSAQTVVPGGNVSGTWDLPGSPYLVEGEIAVPFGETLTIDPGVEVIFQGHYKFIVNGFLEAVGTETDSILFTAANTITGWHGIRFINAPDNSHLSYCIVEYGRATGPEPDYHAGGIFCNASSPVISHCTIRECSAEVSGGGIGCIMNSYPQILNCLIENCSSYGGDGEGGGGLACGFDSNPVIDGCTFNGNYANNVGGGIGSAYDAFPIISNCTLTGNSASGGGGGLGMYQSGPTITACTINGNSTLDVGGGIFCQENSDPSISNCTISGNSASSDGGGIYCIQSSTPEIDNTIVEGNSGNGGVYFDQSPEARFSYCDFYNNEGGDFTGEVPTGLGVITGVNLNGDPCDDFANIFLDPEFVYPTQNDYRLSWGSPCIDAGMGTDPDATIADMGAFFYDQSMPLRVLLTPFDMPIEIPAGGGRFDYYIQVTNIAMLSLNVDAWCDVTLPDGSIFGPTLGPVNVDVGSEATIGRERTQTVPVGAPEGTYIYHAYATAGSDTTHDSFAFIKLGSDGSEALSGWFNTGESFIAEDIGGGSTPALRDDFALCGAFPNPFNPLTTISYRLPEDTPVELTIYDAAGRLVETLVNGHRRAGSHEATFDATALSSGLYLCRIEAGDFTSVKKMMLMK